MPSPGRPRRARHEAALRRAPRLVTRFAVLSAIATLVVGAGILWFVRHDAAQRAEQKVTRDAAVLATVLRELDMNAADLDAPLSGARRDMWDNVLERSLLGSLGESISFYSLSGRRTYSLALGQPDSDRIRPKVRGATSGAPGPADFANAATSPIVLGSGRLPRGVGAAPGGRRVVNVLVPIRLQNDSLPRGFLQLEQDYALTQASIDASMRRTAIALGIALLVFYAVLFPILLSASRRLRVQASENQRLALHDSLTGLPNRTLFRDRVGQALLAARRGGPSVAVMLMDLDRFKEINDTLGHQAGDRVLQEVSARLTRVLRESDTIARLGGDEFAVLLPGVTDAEAAARVSRVILASLEEPVVIQEMALDVDASLGIALAPEHGDDVDVLIRCADVAMYRAKGGRTGFSLYTPEGEEEGARDRLALAAELRHAAALGQIEVHYQPKCCMRSGRVTGVEALVRWRHPRLGMLSPDVFIAIAEQSGIIRGLTLHVLDAALAQSRLWQDDGFPVGVAVNLSAHHLLDRDLPGDVAHALRRARVDASMLELEITESTVMANPVRAREVLEALRAMGVRVAIDDFGVGHSSLGQLAELPVSVLKIDRSFVQEMTPDSRAALIVRSTIELGRNLGLEVVAEGVETASCWDELARLGCDVAQGYLVARPLPGDEIEDVILRRGLRAPYQRGHRPRHRTVGDAGAAPELTASRG